MLPPVRSGPGSGTRVRTTRPPRARERARRREEGEGKLLLLAGRGGGRREEGGRGVESRLGWPDAETASASALVGRAFEAALQV